MVNVFCPNLLTKIDNLGDVNWRYGKGKGCVRVCLKRDIRGLFEQNKIK